MREKEGTNGIARSSQFTEYCIPVRIPSCHFSRTGESKLLSQPLAEKWRFDCALFTTNFAKLPSQWLEIGIVECQELGVFGPGNTKSLCEPCTRFGYVSHLTSVTREVVADLIGVRELVHAA